MDSQSWPHTWIKNNGRKRLERNVALRYYCDIPTTFAIFVHKSYHQAWFRYVGYSLSSRACHDFQIIKQTLN